MLILCLIAFFFEGTPDSNRHCFSVWKGSDKVGTLSAWQRTDGARTAYHLKSDVNIDLLLSIQIKEEITDVFEGGFLKTSSHQRHINGDLRASNTCVWSERGYIVTDHDDDEQSVLRDSIFTSVLSIYFAEPTADSWAYSQNFRQMVLLKKIDHHTFRIDLPGGGTTTYTYQNSKLHTVVSKTKLGTVRFVSEPAHSAK